VISDFRRQVHPAPRLVRRRLARARGSRAWSGKGSRPPAWFGPDDTRLEGVAAPEVYLRVAEDLVTGPDSVVRRVAAAPLSEPPVPLSSKCGGCLHSENGTKWCAAHAGLPLLPRQTEVEKAAQQQVSVATVRDLAPFKGLAPAAGLSEGHPRRSLFQQQDASGERFCRLERVAGAAGGRRQRLRRLLAHDTAAAAGVPGLPPAGEHRAVAFPGNSLTKQGRPSSFSRT
jgi:hypothetical protein